MALQHKVLAVCALALTGCTSGLNASLDGMGDRRVTNVELVPARSNPSEIGRLLLAPSGARTGVTVIISGIPGHMSRPVHLYTYIYPGRCGSLVTQPAFDLTGRVLATANTAPGQYGSGPYTLRTEVDVPIDVLKATPYAFVVRSAPADGNVDLFCGNID